MPDDVVARPAGPQDIDELIRLRAVMLSTVHGAAEARVDDDWAAAAADLMRRELAAGDRMAAMVVDAPDGRGLAASGVAFIDLRLPAPGRLGCRVGHVSSMSTDPRWRRRGYARAVLDALTDWLAEQGCERVELSASEEGMPLYRQRGFVDPPGPSLRRPLP